MAEGESLPAVMTLPAKYTPEEQGKKVEELRKLFDEKFADNLKSGEYDSRDVERFRTHDHYARCFLTTAKVQGDVQKAANSVNEVFHFRKEMGVWEWTDETFPKDLWERKGLYYHGADRKGNPILQVRVKMQNAKTPEEMALFKRFMVWHFEKHHREHAGLQRCVVMYDMEGAGITNLNRELSSYVIKLFDYFPSFAIYVLNFEMPWLLSAVWKAICFFLSEEQKNRIVMTSKKDLTKYIDKEHLLEHQK